MKKLGLIPGDTMIVTNININKATYVKFYFRDGTFGTLSNPRAVYSLFIITILVLRIN